MLCGDEVGSVVCDIGGAWSKFGCAGEDSPHHIVRSDVGYIEEEMTEGPCKSFRVGDIALRLAQVKLEVENPYSASGKNNTYSSFLIFSAKMNTKFALIRNIKSNIIQYCMLTFFEINPTTCRGGKLGSCR